MILGVPLWVLAVIALALLVGTMVQGLVGLGLGLVGAPVATLVAPELMPGLLLCTAVVLPVLQLAGNREQIDWRGLAWALPARLPGTVLGVWLVASFTERQLSVAVGVMVLAAVLLTWHTVTVPITPGTLVGAGIISGVTSTATSIGGPPIAILYQHRSPVQIRSTLAVYFALGAVISLAGLGISGQLQAREIWLAALFVPCLLVGLWLSRRVGARVSPVRIRNIMLAVCAASALALLVRALAG
ncbi:sulfite exporter TauE/SafE family protein [Ornithinimicrobium faecis]|uniref:Probable membrane transporter protein n=1 Tax=Ornithinimicrobium faecis TaxID=2934158 RepID=A0ABY4YPD5_9MICO|nr:sulfite exporter TauE/SafE family protein [Ornithinimicrobium sp. HY1793]USQ78643.1 sulfite exporter TauE/SafE family protein [Ornithinimicrobium sp. HY1793]